MKTRLHYLLGVLTLLFVALLPAQEPASPPQNLTSEQIDQLLGPIALYPDALIALILPASTSSSDIVLASRYLQTGNDPAGVDSQPWDDSVRSLAHYPEIVKWMDQNLAWTKQLGDLFATQPVDAMQSIQRLRTVARAAGTLVDTPQQQIIVEGDAISIEPAQPDVIYVPYYDPNVVYVARPGFYGDSFLTFGPGFPVGAWLSFDLDWGNRRIWFINHDERERYWREHRDWRHPVFPGRSGYVRDPDRHPWRPMPDYTRPSQADVRRMRTEIVRPGPLPSAPPRPPVRRQDLLPGRPGNRDHPTQVDARGRGAPSVSPVHGQDVVPAIPDNRDRPTPADARGRDRDRDRNAPPARPPVVAAPTPPANPPTPIVRSQTLQPQVPPPVRRPEGQLERNDPRQPDQRGREFQGNPANRPPTAMPPQGARIAPGPRPGPATPPPAPHGRPVQPAPAPPSNQSPPPQPPSTSDEKKKSD